MNSPQREPQENPVAGLAALLFQGGAVMTWTLSAWSLTSSLSITGSFAAGAGMFSNWIALALCGVGLWYTGKLVERELTEHCIRISMPKLPSIRRSHSIPPDDSSAATA
jgi:hypothetical protein